MNTRAFDDIRFREYFSSTSVKENGRVQLVALIHFMQCRLFQIGTVNYASYAPVCLAIVLSPSEISFHSFGALL